MYKQTTCFDYKKRNTLSLILLHILSGVQSPFIKLIVKQDNRLSEAVGSENNFMSFHGTLLYNHRAIRMHFS